MEDPVTKGWPIAVFLALVTAYLAFHAPGCSRPEPPPYVYAGESAIPMVLTYLCDDRASPDWIRPCSPEVPSVAVDDPTHGDQRGNVRHVEHTWLQIRNPGPEALGAHPQDWVRLYLYAADGRPVSVQPRPPRPDSMSPDRTQIQLDEEGGTYIDLLCPHAPAGEATPTPIPAGGTRIAYVSEAFNDNDSDLHPPTSAVLRYRKVTNGDLGQELALAYHCGWESIANRRVSQPDGTEEEQISRESGTFVGKELVTGRRKPWRPHEASD